MLDLFMQPPAIFRQANDEFQRDKSVLRDPKKCGTIFVPFISSGSRGPSAVIDRTAGTTYSGSTAPGGSLASTRARAFDGTNSGAFGGAAAYSDNGTSVQMFIGKQMAAPVALYRAIVYGSNNVGFVNSGNPSITLSLYGKNGSQPAFYNDGTLLASVTFADTADESAGRVLLSTDQATYWNFYHVALDKPTVNSLVGLTEIVIEGWV